MAQPRPPRQGSFWRSYKALNKRSRVGLGCAFLFAAFTTCTFFAAATGAVLTTAFPVTMTPVVQATATSAPPTQVAQVVQVTPTSKVVQLTPTSTPVPLKPTAAPTTAPTAAPVPTQVPTTAPTKPPPPPPTQPPPAPTQPPSGVNGNPWGYDFNPGNLISIPPDGFCNYFACIATFYAADDPGDGYIIECVDGTYSQSGGESGACSHHGGEMRTLYSH